MKIVVLDGYTLNPGDLSWEAFQPPGGKRQSMTARRWRRSPRAHRVTRMRCLSTKRRSRAKRSRPARIYDTSACLLPAITSWMSPPQRNGAFPYAMCRPTARLRVAQHAIAMLLEITNRVSLHSDAVHAGRWAGATDWCFWDALLIELEGKTMASSATDESAGAQARSPARWGCAFWHIKIRRRSTTVARACRSSRLFAESDVISLHCPLLPKPGGSSIGLPSSR